MKKLTFITVVAFIFSMSVDSSAQFFAGAWGGYGFPSNVKAFSSNTTINGNSVSVTSQSISRGSGVSAGVYGGYMVTKNIGFELGVSEKFSSSNTSTGTTSTADSFPPRATTTTTIHTAKAGLLSLTPGIRLMVGDGKLKVYTVTGLIFAFPSAVTFENNSTSTTTSSSGSVTNVSDEIYTYSGGMIIGFHGAAGIVYMLSDKIGIFGEVFGNIQNWAPGQRLITTDTYNGADVLNNLTTNEKQTNYESSYTYSTNASTPGSPAQSPKIYLPFSSWGINIGVHFSFGGNAAATATPQ